MIYCILFCSFHIFCVLHCVRRINLRIRQAYLSLCSLQCVHLPHIRTIAATLYYEFAVHVDNSRQHFEIECRNKIFKWMQINGKWQWHADDGRTNEETFFFFLN